MLELQEEFLQQILRIRLGLYDAGEVMKQPRRMGIVELFDLAVCRHGRLVT